MKKILLSFLVIVVLVIPNNYVIALKNGIETKVTEEKTPVSVEQVTNVQSLKSGYGADPVLYDDYLYTIKTADWGSGSNGELLKINKSTMEIENRVELIGKTGYTPFITAGDEQIFVPLSDGRVQAFDAKTLVSTWVSKTPEKVGEVASHLTYHDGYLYYGIGGYSANQGDLFICVSTKDEDISQQFETKELNWVYDQGQGYYWSEAVVINDCIAFSGYDGKVVLHDLKDDKVYDTLDLGIGKITNSLFYDQETNKLVAANTNGYIVTVDVDDHDFDVGAGCELAHIGQTGAVVNEITARNTVVENAEVLLRDLQRFVHPLADGHGRHHDDELGEAETLVQLKDGFGIDVGFPGSRLHFHAELPAFQIMRHGQGIAFLHCLHVGEHGGVINEQGIADAVLIFQQGKLFALDNGKGGGLLFLTDEQVGHGIDGGCLERLFDEFEFHARRLPAIPASIRCFCHAGYRRRWTWPYRRPGSFRPERFAPARTPPFPRPFPRSDRPTGR